MAIVQAACHCGSDKVSMVPAGGGRGTKDSLFFTGECEACGFMIEHLPENSDGRRATAIRDWNREVKALASQAHPGTRASGTKVHAVHAVRAPAQAFPAARSPRKVKVPQQYRSSTPEQLRALARAYNDKADAVGPQLLLDAAAEIEGSEEAYAVLVAEIDALRARLILTEKNLHATIAMIPCGQS